MNVVIVSVSSVRARRRRRIFASALAALALTAIACPASAQPSDTPNEYIPLPTSSQQPVSKSDEHRIVGKVLELDGGLVKLATEEGVVTVEAPARTARVFRIGDTVSVPRSSTESPSASPRQ